MGGLEPKFFIVKSNNFDFGGANFDKIFVRLEAAHTLTYFEEHNEYDFTIPNLRDYVEVDAKEIESDSTNPIFMFDESVPESEEYKLMV